MNLRTNVCFHGIGDPGDRPEDEAAYWIAPDFFRRVLDLCAGRSDVALSFDDGCRSDIDVALPELEQRGLGATFFVLAGRLTRRDSLSATDLQVLRSHGMTIGSHGWHHVPWSFADDDALRVELLDARAAIAEAAGVAVAQAACPLGRYDRRVLARLRQAGYSTVFTSDRAVARAGAWLQPRFSVRRADDIAQVQDYLRHGSDRVRRVRDALRIGIKSLR
ncbi:polysaccharide deacetylase family protein [Salana multivorans]